MKTLRVIDVAAKLGIATSTVWKLLSNDPAFPKPFKLAPRVTVWREDLIDNWILLKENPNESQ